MQQQAIGSSYQQAQLAPPRILIVDDQHMSQQLDDQLFLRINDEPAIELDCTLDEREF